jgi:ribosome-associated protein
MRNAGRRRTARHPEQIPDFRVIIEGRRPKIWHEFRNTSGRYYRRWTITTTPTVTRAEDRTEASRQFAIDVARLAANTRCHNVVVLDVTGLSPVTDYYVLATGSSGRQMRAVMKDLEELAQSRGYNPLSRSGYEGETWLLCDMVDVIAHVFNQESRMFYDLDNLWGDAKRIEWRTPEQIEQQAALEK